MEVKATIVPVPAPEFSITGMSLNQTLWILGALGNMYGGTETTDPIYDAISKAVRPHITGHPFAHPEAERVTGSLYMAKAPK